MRITLKGKVKGKSAFDTFLEVVKELKKTGKLRQIWEVESITTGRHFQGNNAIVTAEAVVLRLRIERRPFMKLWEKPVLVNSPVRMVLQSVSLQELLDAVQIDFGFSDQPIPFSGVVSEPREAGIFIGRKFGGDFKRVIDEFQSRVEKLIESDQSQPQAQEASA